MPQISALKFDVSRAKNVESAAREVESAFGKLHIVISNAGIFNVAPVADLDPDAWRETWVVNLRGPYLVACAFVPLLLMGGDMTAITISSVGTLLTNPKLSAYQTSKFLQLRLMEFVSAEYGKKGVLALSVHPGNIPEIEILGPAGLPEVLKPCEFLQYFVDLCKLRRKAIDLV